MSKQLVKPFYGSDTWAGGCLPATQNVFGAPGGPVSATASANATKFRHTGPLPKDTTAILWMDHYGTYTNYITGKSYWDNWGHVVVWDPTAFGGKGGFYSSRQRGEGPGEWFRTLAEVEKAFAAKYRGFWSEDINGVRTVDRRPAPAKPTPPKTPVAASPRIGRKNVSLFYTVDGKGGIWALAGEAPGTPANWMETRDQTFANQLARQHGDAARLSPQSWPGWRTAYRSPVTIAK